MSTVAQSSPTAAALAGDDRVGRLKRVLPNALTVLRVLLAGAFFVILSVWHDADTGEGRRTPASGALLVSAVIFVVAAMTDVLDGWLSRKWKVTSIFGRVMDPF